MTPSGHIFYKDYADTLYETVWETIGGVIDLTSTTKQPGVWGQAPEGYIQNKILYRKGIITIHRQVIKPLTDGYEIVAEGISQYIDFIKMNFPCEVGPQDTFKYHLDHNMVDECVMGVSSGPRWADPDNEDDDNAVWADLDSNGDIITNPTVGIDIFEFIDVWSA